MYVNTEKLRRIRESKKVNQLELAEKLFIGQSAYSKIELGKTAVQLDVALKLAYHLNCSICDFVDIPAMYMDVSVNGMAKIYTDQSQLMAKLFELIDQIKSNTPETNIRSTTS